MKQIIALFSLLIPTLFFGLEANAKPVINADPQSFVAALQAKNYSPKLEGLDTNEPMLTATIDDIPFSIAFLSCTNSKTCAHSEIIFPLLCGDSEKYCIEAAANWQKDEHFSSAIYFKENKALVLYHYIATGAGGISEDALIETIENVRLELSDIDESITALEKPKK